MAEPCHAAIAESRHRLSRSQCPGGEGGKTQNLIKRASYEPRHGSMCLCLALSGTAHRDAGAGNVTM